MESTPIDWAVVTARVLEISRPALDFFSGGHMRRRAEILHVIEEALLPKQGWLAPEALTLARQDARKVYAALLKHGIFDA